MILKFSVFVLLALAPAVSFAAESLDVILEGGMVFSGDGSEGLVTDVGITGDRIVAVGDLSGQESEVRLDVTGLAVTPGFVDIHCHEVRGEVEKSGIFLWPDAENYIRQGVTTAIGGPDGSSWYPLAELFGMLEAAPAAINFGTFVGHNTVRELALGRADRAATAQEMQAMKEMVASAMI